MPWNFDNNVINDIQRGDVQPPSLYGCFHATALASYARCIGVPPTMSLPTYSEVLLQHYFSVDIYGTIHSASVDHVHDL